MELEEFASCCGAVLLHDMYMHEIMDANNQLIKDVARFEKHLADNIQNAKKAKYGLLAAITNPAQEDVEPSLQKAGFTLCFESDNPLHGTHLKLWAINLNKIPQPEHPSASDVIDDAFSIRMNLGIKTQGQEDLNPDDDWYDYPDEL